MLVLRRPQSLQCNCPAGGASTTAHILSALSEGRIFKKNLKPKQLQIHAFPRKCTDNARTIKFLETAAHGQPRTTVYGVNRQNMSPRTTTDNHGQRYIVFCLYKPHPTDIPRTTTKCSEKTTDNHGQPRTTTF